ncbi:MAG TPA: UDP-N-acetylmuramoyl-tripeptide--D-alanyl-D-alanine ligase [Thermoanaerobaculia bacterium]|jgi:UDP-N-acetylmuramoyl-tripeptide--D-alanyl-D-alanine ligase|nr:UDP-N-acetylmuramoyl-tripeptide--D-alanyl-D-alanine ligase [Thermoanaerobaculia bacterium]
MPTLTFAQLAAMTGGTLLQGGDLETRSVVIDSREVKPDSVFFAIRGERLDGHQFVPQALQTARGAVVSEVPADVPRDKGIIRVEDTTEALQNLARSIREQRDFQLIAITGSAGKTTTKEMIATLVGTERRTFKSWGNFNNLIGCPLCIDNTPDDAQVVVSEMGMNHKGEIARLAGLTHPDIGVYTNIGPVHIEFFGTIDKIAEAKRELLENVKPGGTIVINADNEYVMRISEQFAWRKVTYGIDHEAEFRATNVKERGLLGTTFELDAPLSPPGGEGVAKAGEGRTVRKFELALPGRHNLENLIAAIATARVAGISWEGIERGVGEVKPAYHRGVIVPWRGATIYDDTYNSNPYALGRALDLLRQAEAMRRIAVIGDMLELGEQELDYHRESGKLIPREIDVVIGVGRRAQALLDGAREAGFPELHHFDDAESAGAFLRDFIRTGDLVLIKASRGIGLDRIVTMLEKEK